MSNFFSRRNRERNYIVFIYFDIKLWKIGMRRLKALQALNEEQYQSSTANDASDSANYGNASTDNDNAGYGNNSWNNGGTSNQNGGDPFSGFKWDV